MIAVECQQYTSTSAIVGNPLLAGMKSKPLFKKAPVFTRNVKLSTGLNGRFYWALFEAF